MEAKLFDSELKVMEVLWREGDSTAKRIAQVLGDEVGWNVNTTRTVIKRCIQKGAIERTEPNFMCHALIAKEEVQQAQTEELINRVYDGSTDKLFAALLSRTKLSPRRRSRTSSLSSTTSSSPTALAGPTAPSDPTTPTGRGGTPL